MGAEEGPVFQSYHCGPSTIRTSLAVTDYVYFFFLTGSHGIYLMAYSRLL